MMLVLVLSLPNLQLQLSTLLVSPPSHHLMKTRVLVRKARFHMHQHGCAMQPGMW